MVWNSASAAATDSPGRSRPMMCSHELPRLVNVRRSSSRIRGSIVSGMVTSDGTPTATPKKSGGVTPTIVNGVPSMRRVWPIADGSPPKRRCHAE